MASCASRGLDAKNCVFLAGQHPKPFNASSQTSYRSPRRKRQGSFTSLLVLSPHNPLRWACAGPPFRGCAPFGAFLYLRGKAQTEKNPSVPLEVMRYFSFATFSTNCCRIVAACALVALPWGARFMMLPSAIPWIMPEPQAHCIAGIAHSATS